MSQSQPSDTAGVTVLPPLVYAGGLVVGYIVQFILPIAVAPPTFDVAIRVLGVLLVLFGGYLMFTALGLFQKVGTPVSPHEPTRALTFDGPYRYTRNPIYLGMALILAGLALVGNALWPLLAVIPVIWWITTQVIVREERYLEAKFGAPYADFKKRVRRWL
ncbi:MAG: isoprenylcysteine carboxylmethyltransferase family protein [Bauldia sp.]